MEIKEHPLVPSPREFLIEKNDDIFLIVDIGNGQVGGNKVSLGNKVIAKGNLTKPAYLGKASKLKEKEIEIETNVLDVNDFTNMCVIKTTFVNQDNIELYSKLDKGEAPKNGVASFKGSYIMKIMMIVAGFFLSL